MILLSRKEIFAGKTVIHSFPVGENKKLGPEVILLLKLINKYVIYKLCK